MLVHYTKISRLKQRFILKPQCEGAEKVHIMHITRSWYRIKC